MHWFKAYLTLLARWTWAWLVDCIIDHWSMVSIIWKGISDFIKHMLFKQNIELYICTEANKLIHLFFWIFHKCAIKLRANDSIHLLSLVNPINNVIINKFFSVHACGPDHCFNSFSFVVDIGVASTACITHRGSCRVL